MGEADVQQAVLAHLRQGGHVTLFLDYDGTLIPIAPTPAEALPDPDLLELLKQLCEKPPLRTVILSGRPLEDLQRMLPVQGLIIAGLYGVEMQMGDSTVLREPSHDAVRQRIVQVRDSWEKLAGGLQGFLLEDKGQAIALHARWADAEPARRVLAAARTQATDIIDTQTFRILDGDRYIEVAPVSADKGETVDWLLSHYPIARDLPVGFGDDNKDEAAFAVIRRRGGFAVGVGYRYELPDVDARVDSPEQARKWMRTFLGS